MLFTFGKVWKYTTVILGGWILYGIFGFEFTAITLLATITATVIGSPKLRL